MWDASTLHYPFCFSAEPLFRRSMRCNADHDSDHVESDISMRTPNRYTIYCSEGLEMQMGFRANKKKHQISKQEKREIKISY
jgi:hypothetical protein